MSAHLFPVFFVLYGIHCTAWFCIQHEVKAGIFAETTGIAQERVFFVVVDRPDGNHALIMCNHLVCFRSCRGKRLHFLPALVALIHILATVAAHTRVGGH